MIIVRSPLRISLGGGGTDFHSYYSKFGGELLTAAIDKYVYVSITKPFIKGYFLKYSKQEKTNDINKIEHDIIRETIRYIDKRIDQIEIITLADIPAGTGLGSSGSFTSALIFAIHAYKGVYIEKKDLAEAACHVEIDILKEPIGKQDQYITSFGGINNIIFNKNNDIQVNPLQLNNEIIYKMEDNLLLFFTGYSRKASNILLDQDKRSKSNETDIIKNLDYVKKLGILSKKALEKGNLDELGEIMNEHWENKKKRSKGMSNDKINYWYNAALENGAIGGKLVGAGGGGFLMFVAKDRAKLRKKMAEFKLEEVRFRFDYEGTKIMMRS